MTIDDYISQLMTCASAPPCKKERACFEVAKYALACRRNERLESALERVGQTNAEDEFDCFAPHWEAHLPPWRA